MTISDYTIMGKRNFKYIMVVICLVQILDTYCTTFPYVIPSFIAKEFLSDYPLNVQQSIMALATGLVTMGMYFLFITQYLADKIGRKKMLMISVFGMALASLGMFLSTSFLMYMFWLLILNFFFSSDIWLIYITEESKPNKRAVYSNIALIIGLIGAILMIIFRFIFITESVSFWRGLTLFPIILGFILSAVIALTLKETSKFQLMRAEPSKIGKRSFKDDIKLLFKIESRKSYIALLIITFIGGASGIYLGLFEMYVSNTGTLNQSQITIIFFLTIFTVFIAYIINGTLADRIGRKPLYYLWASIIPFSVILWVFGAKDTRNAFILVLLGYSLTQISHWGILGVVRLSNIELLPTDRRGTGVGLRSLMGALGRTVGLLLSSIIILYAGLGTTFIIFIFGAFFIIPLTFFYLKETKGLELKEIK